MAEDPDLEASDVHPAIRWAHSNMHRPRPAALDFARAPSCVWLILIPTDQGAICVPPASRCYAHILFKYRELWQETIPGPRRVRQVARDSRRRFDKAQ